MSLGTIFLYLFSVIVVTKRFCPKKLITPNLQVAFWNIIKENQFWLFPLQKCRKLHSFYNSFALNMLKNSDLLFGRAKRSSSWLRSTTKIFNIFPIPVVMLCRRQDDNQRCCKALHKWYIDFPLKYYSKHLTISALQLNISRPEFEGQYWSQIRVAIESIGRSSNHSLLPKLLVSYANIMFNKEVFSIGKVV